MNKLTQFAAISLVISACASRTPEARIATASHSNSSPAPQAQTLSPEDREATVQISKTLIDRCKIQDLPQTAPRFDYDRATLHARGRNVLDDVANCLIDGPLREESITLVGRTDPRGTQSYNQGLGASRAEAARDYLALRGVPADRMRLLSRGEEGARGNDEATYAVDRRVDIEFGDLKNNPILEGSMLQSETSRSRVPAHNQAASYADTAEGGKPVEDK